MLSAVTPMNPLATLPRKKVEQASTSDASRSLGKPGAISPPRPPAGHEPHTPRQRLVMCRPQFLSTRIPNNVWMKNKKVDVPRALKQWDRVKNVLLSFGAEVLDIPAVKGCQDQTYVANIGIALKPYIVLANYKAPGRDCEIPPAKKFFEGLGYKTIQPPFDFEGEADLKKWKDGVYFGGYGQFTDAKALNWISSKTGIQIIPLQEVSKKLYHLDCSLFIVDEENILVTKEGISPASLKTLEKLANVTITPPEVAITGCTNAVKVPDEPIILSGTFNPEMPEYRKAMEWMNATFDKFGYTCVFMDVDEYDKSGADLSCTVFHLDF